MSDDESESGSGSENEDKESGSGSGSENEGSGSEDESGSGSGSGSGDDESGSGDDDESGSESGSGSGSGSDDDEKSGSGSEHEEKEKKEDDNGRFKKIHIDLVWDPKSKKFVSSKSNVDPSSEDQEQAVKKIEKAFQNFQERKSWGVGHPLFGDKEKEMTRKQKINRAISLLMGEDSPQDKELLKLQKKKYSSNPEKWDPVIGALPFRKPDFMDSNYSQFQENSSQKPNGALFSKEIYDGSLQFDRFLQETPTLFNIDAPRHVNPNFVRQMENEMNNNDPSPYRNNNNMNNAENYNNNDRNYNNNDRNYNLNGNFNNNFNSSPPNLPPYQSSLPLYI